MRASYFIIILFGAALLTTRLWSSGYRHPPGILVREEPHQESTSPKKWTKNGYLVTALASYSIKARVLLTDDYKWSSGADLSPKDLTVAWGALSDTAILNQLEFGHSMRYFTWRAAKLPIGESEIISHTANMHIIPADILVEKKLKRVTRDDIVQMDGYLVDVDRPDGFHWGSSTTRQDSGMGACELMWVESLEISER